MEGATMGMLVKLVLLSAATPLLGGCVVASVGGAIVSAGATVVSTTVDVAGTAVKGVAHTVAGSDKKDDASKKSDGG
jgi:hypothetical protein